jgi:hypothetical protein
MTATVVTGKHSLRSAARDVGLGRSVSQTLGGRSPFLLSDKLWLQVAGQAFAAERQCVSGSPQRPHDVWMGVDQ